MLVVVIVLIVLFGTPAMWCMLAGGYVHWDFNVSDYKYETRSWMLQDWALLVMN